jgi:enoyl-CoA hydratase
VDTPDGSSDAVRLSRPAPGVRLITLNRPDRLNAIDESLVDGLHAALDVVADDADCRAVVLTGAGRGFCAGFDMKTARGADFAAGRRHPVAATLRGQSRLSDLVRRLRALAPPVIAAVNGPAAGGGLALALAADIRIAAPSAVFLVANVRLGLSGGEMGIAYLLPRIIGAGRAAELMLSGRTVDAQEAHFYGLVTTIAEDPVAVALDVAETVAGHGRFGVEMTKELLTISMTGTDLDTVLALENRTQVLASMTEEMERAVGAFRGQGSDDVEPPAAGGAA